MKTFQGLLKSLPENGIYVFPSHISGKHDSGVAKIALENFGAIYGKAFGMHNRCYPICFKFYDLSRDMRFMKAQIETFYRIAKRDNSKDFYVMYNGLINLSVYQPKDILEIFRSHPIPDNIVFEETFAAMLQGKQIKKQIIDDEI